MKFITRANSVLLSRTIGPALTRTDNPQPNSILFALTDQTTGQTITLDEDMAIYLIGQMQEEIRMYSQYNTVDRPATIS